MTECNEPGSWKGLCCCNCQHQCEISKHPWNKDEPFKGKLSEAIGYGCAVEFDLHRQGSGDLWADRRVVFFDRKHGMCEMHTPRVESDQ